MIALFLTFTAFAADRAPWVGLPSERLATIGLLAPTVSEEMPGLSRYPLVSGGLVSLFVTPSVDEANRVFDRMEKTGATFWPTATGPLPGERAVGDGLASILVRDGNVVVFVRDLDGHAGAVAERVIAALQ
jgi:hypothetical protein